MTDRTISRETLHGGGKSTGISRRSVVAGAAWAAPVVAVAVAAPAMAVSGEIPPNALNGWVQLQRSCPFLTNRTELTIDGVGSYPDRGLWVLTTAGPPTYSPPSNAKLIFFFERSNLSFSNQSQSGWSNLTRSPSDDEISGYYAYATTYSGTWTFRGTNPNNQRWDADSNPRFRTTFSTSGGCQVIRAYARRTVTFMDETVTFRRGPVIVG